MKKKVIFILVFCLLFASSIGITYSYLISNDTKTNTMIVGDVKIKLKEEFEPVTRMDPGMTIMKKAWVTNEGNLPSYVRMSANFSDSDAESFADLKFDTDNWEYNSTDGYYYYKKVLEPGTSTPSLFKERTIKLDSAGNSVSSTPYTMQIKWVQKSQLKDFNLFVYTEGVDSKLGNNTPSGQKPYIYAFSQITEN